MRKTLFVCSLVAAGVMSATLPAAAQSYPPYGNTIRQWVEVTAVYDTTDNQNIRYIAFEGNTEAVPGWPSEFLRFECGQGATLVTTGCDQNIAIGDSILVRGYSKGRLSCAHDGLDSVTHVSVLWRCDGWTVGTCEQLTPVPTP